MSDYYNIWIMVLIENQFHFLFIMVKT